MNTNKVLALCAKITEETRARIVANNLACEANLIAAEAHYHTETKYFRVDVGTSGRYMIERSTERIYGIKAYGVINKGHYYGTLDTIDDYFWGEYAAIPKGTR